MSVELFVLMKKERQPRMDAILEYVRKRDVAIVSEVSSLDDHSGFLPVEFDGEETGFEFSWSSTRELAEDYDPLESSVNRYPLAACFVWGGDEAEMRAVGWFVLAMLELSNGVLFDPQEGETVLDTKAAVQVAKELIDG